MDTNYWTSLSVRLKPIYWRNIPEITYGVNQDTINTIPVSTQCTISLNLPLNSGSHKFWITYNNKDYRDCILDKNLDMSIEIESVMFEGMIFDRFKWAGFFYPDYPADYPDKQPVIKSATYLGWNGRWELPFTTPIFTWIHQLENLGWLYEP